MRILTKTLLVIILALLAFGTSTAYACGCGIYIPREGDATVSQERALVRWDGQREDIVLSLGVLGGSQQAAIILPVPSQADVKLADANLFDQLAEMTKPLEREEIEWVFFPSLGNGALPPEGALGAGAPPVNVLSRQTLGPFDVANLAATDSAALQTWLDDNGFQLDPAVVALMQPYVADAWTFVAVRISPDQATAQLSGDLQPLWISFDSPELVYPMRASSHAKNTQSMFLYILADHRINKQNNFGSSRVAYADWVEPSALPANSALAPLATRKLFLTKYQDTIIPNEVDGDFLFAPATDETYREVIVRRVQRDVSGIVLLAFCALVLIGIIGFVVLTVVVARRRQAVVSR